MFNRKCYSLLKHIEFPGDFMAYEKPTVEGFHDASYVASSGDGGAGFFHGVRAHPKL